MEEKICTHKNALHTHNLPENARCSVCDNSLKSVFGATHCPDCGWGQCRTCNLKNCVEMHFLSENSSNNFLFCSLCSRVSKDIKFCSICRIYYCKNCIEKKYSITAFCNFSCTDENSDGNQEPTKCLICGNKIPFRTLTFECKECLKMICLNCVREESMMKLQRMLSFLKILPLTSFLNNRVLHCPHKNFIHAHDIKKQIQRCLCCEKKYFVDEGNISMFRCVKCQEYFCSLCVNKTLHTSLIYQISNKFGDAIIAFRDKLKIYSCQCYEKDRDKRDHKYYLPFLKLCGKIKGKSFTCNICSCKKRNSMLYWKCTKCTI